MKRDISSLVYEHYDINPTIITTNKFLIESKIRHILEMQEDAYKEEMRRFFPTIWNSFKGNIQYILPIFAPPNNHEQNTLRKYIRGINFEVRLNHDPQRNAYTYPWIDSGLLATATAIPVVGGLLYFINGFSRVFSEKHKLEPQVGDGFVSFPKANGLKVMAFQTKGLLTDLDERQRAAIMLHEIGHWYNAKSALVSGMIGAGDSIMDSMKKQGLMIFPPLAFAVFIAYNLINRHAEKSADIFAKECGFGNDLASALERITLRPRSDVNWLNKVGDWITKIFFEIQNKLDRFLPFLYNYPSPEKRIEYLKDSQQYYDNELARLELIEKMMIEGKLQEIGLKLLKIPLNKMDAIVGKNLKALFPIK